MSADPAPYSCLDELAILRLTAQDAVNAYATARDRGDEAQILTYGAILREVLHSVADFAKKTQALDLQQVLAVHTVTNVIQAFETVLRTYFVGDPRVDQILDELPSLVKLETAAEGTTLLPSDAVGLMDSLTLGAS